MSRKVRLFSAKCGNCKVPFERPSLGDFSYGENIFSTTDGRSFILASAFEDFPERLRGLISDTRTDMFWIILAKLADPVEDLNLTSEIVCPNCGSTSIKMLEGDLKGELMIDDASYMRASSLSDRELSEFVAKCITKL